MELSTVKIPKPVRWIGFALSAPFVAVLVLAIGVMFAIIYPVHLKRKYISPRTGWKRWFAWHPVPVLDPQWPQSEGFLDWVWLETVEREYRHKFGKLRYCRPHEREALEASRLRWRQYEEGLNPARPTPTSEP